MNPAIGPSYYPETEDASPWFAGVSTIPDGDPGDSRGELIDGEDAIQFRKLAGSDHQMLGLVLWKKTGDGSAFGFHNGRAWTKSVTLATNSALSVVYRNAKYSNSAFSSNEIRYVLQKGTAWYISQNVADGTSWTFNTWYTNRVDNPASLAWYTYDPEANVVPVGSLANLTDFSDISAVGFQIFGERTGDTDAASMAVRFFEALSMPVLGIYDPATQAGILGKSSNTNETQSTNHLAAAFPYIYPTVYQPVGGGIRLDVPTGLAGQSRKEQGILDVTQLPFSADPTGATDATQALQDAVDFARDHQMIAFFPPGTYRISDTLEMRQNLALRDNYAVTGAAQYPCILIGSSTNSAHRAVIRLAPSSPGFNNESSRKFAVHFSNRTKDRLNLGVDYPQANINYNHVFSDIDIEIGEGNPGAVGIRMQGAEGSCIQNVTIDATHGLAGMQGASGSGGSHHHITVIGGKVGIDTRGCDAEFDLTKTGTQPTPTLSYVTLLHQTERALINNSRGPLIGVGWKIVTSGNGPVIEVLSASAPLNSTLSLIDSEIIFENPSAANTILTAARSVYFKDVYVSNATHLVSGVAGQASGWLHVQDFAYPIDPPLFLSEHQFEMAPYVNGQQLSEPFYRSAADTPPPSDLRSKHIWDEAFPSWETPGAANVKEEYGAVGDGYHDDTAAIQQAIDENEIVYLPKGYFRISDTLQLRPNTKLVGIAKHLSVIMARGDDEASFGPIHDPENPKPLVATANDAEAETVLSKLGLLLTFHVSTDATDTVLGSYALRWQAGRKSVFRDVEVTPWRIIGFPVNSALFAHLKALDLEHPLVLISGNGGGKWYTFFDHGAYAVRPDYRHILVKGTRQPLHFYHLHAQDNAIFAQCEFRDAWNISVYGVKTEYVNNDNEFDTRFLWIRNCDHIRLFGHGGNARPATGQEHYLIEDTPNYLISNMGDQVWNDSTNTPTLYRYASETSGGTETLNLPSLHRPIVLLRGEPLAPSSILLPEDGDMDGLPDAWETYYFGSGGAQPDDLCANGVNTVLEAYIAGLDPTDADARFSMIQDAVNVIRWNAATGRVYTVYWTSNLLNGFQLLQTDCTGGVFIDSVYNAAGCGFYKLDVQLEP